MASEIHSLLRPAPQLPDTRKRPRMDLLEVRQQAKKLAVEGLQAQKTQNTAEHEGDDNEQDDDSEQLQQGRQKEGTVRKRRRRTAQQEWVKKLLQSMKITVMPKITINFSNEVVEIIKELWWKQEHPGLEMPEKKADRKLGKLCYKEYAAVVTHGKRPLPPDVLDDIRALCQQERDGNNKNSFRRVSQYLKNNSSDTDCNNFGTADPSYNALLDDLMNSSDNQAFSSQNPLEALCKGNTSSLPISAQNIAVRCTCAEEDISVVSYFNYLPTLNQLLNHLEDDFLREKNVNIKISCIKAKVSNQYNSPHFVLSTNELIRDYFTNYILSTERPASGEPQCTMYVQSDPYPTPASTILGSQIQEAEANIAGSLVSFEDFTDQFSPQSLLFVQSVSSSCQASCFMCLAPSVIALYHTARSLAHKARLKYRASSLPSLLKSFWAPRSFFPSIVSLIKLWLQLLRRPQSSARPTIHPSSQTSVINNKKSETKRDSKDKHL